MQWQGDTLTANRLFEGQRREVTLQLRDVGGGAVAVACRLTFTGATGARRPNEVYDPAILLKMLGDALSRGFGAPAQQR